MKRKTISKRMWLAPSDHESFSYVAYTQDSYDDEDTVNVTIADCHRSVTYYCSGKAGLKKLDRLIDMLEEARGIIQEGME